MFHDKHEQTFYQSTWVFTHFGSEGAVIKHSYAFAFCFCYFFLIKGTKTGDSDAANIKECLTYEDFVPLQLRARSGNGDEEENVVEEKDDDTHESPTFHDQKIMSLFYCPMKSCIGNISSIFYIATSYDHR